MPSRLGCLVLGLLLIASGGGCREDAMLAVRTNWYIADIPVPKGFDRNVDESTYKADAKGRRILDVYEGGADPIKVRNFYKTNMLGQQWVFENESLAGSIYTLNYTKGKRSARSRSAGHRTRACLTRPRSGSTSKEPSRRPDRSTARQEMQAS